MGEMRVLNDQGDVKVEWDPADRESVAKAKAEFERLQGEGYLFYEVAEARGKQIKKFTKGLGKVLAAPGARSDADKRREARPAAMAGGPVARRESVRR